MMGAVVAICFIFSIADVLAGGLGAVVIGPIGYAIERTRRQSLPRAMRNLSADDLSALYTDEELEAVWRALPNNSKPRNLILARRIARAEKNLKTNGGSK